MCNFLCTAIGQENQPPVVRIITPVANEKFSSGTLVPFDISVRDKGDGYTEYDEK